MRYYFLVCSLPTLSIGTKPELSYEDLSTLLTLNLDPKDAKLVFQFNLYTDIRNLKGLWFKKKLIPGGNFDEKELSEVILGQESVFPEYVYSYMKKYEDLLYRLKNFTYLLSRFLKEQIEIQTGFLRSYFQFERDWRVLLSAFRTKDLKRDLSYELQYEDSKDFFISFIFSQKERENLEFPQEYQSLKDLLLQHHSDPQKLYRAFLEYRFQKIEELSEMYSFRIDTVIAYLAKFMLIQEWNQMNEEKGKEILDSLEKGKL